MTFTVHYPVYKYTEGSVREREKGWKKGCTKFYRIGG